MALLHLPGMSVKCPPPCISSGTSPKRPAVRNIPAVSLVLSPTRRIWAGPLFSSFFPSERYTRPPCSGRWAARYSVHPSYQREPPPRRFPRRRRPTGQTGRPGNIRGSPGSLSPAEWAAWPQESPAPPGSPPEKRGLPPRRGLSPPGPAPARAYNPSPRRRRARGESWGCARRTGGPAPPSCLPRRAPPGGMVLPPLESAAHTLSRLSNRSPRSCSPLPSSASCRF